MSEIRYWFARRHPLDDPRKNLVPVTWQGWVVTALFMFGALASVASLFQLQSMGMLWWGILSLIVLAIVSVVFYLYFVATRSDLERTMFDYREMRKGRQS